MVTKVPGLRHWLAQAAQHATLDLGWWFRPTLGIEIAGKIKKLRKEWKGLLESAM